MNFKSDFAKILIHWYLENHRDLPWRSTKDPYNIWVSEIILQQTRVNQGLGYYTRFILKFPDLRSLANASADEVMKAWEGLGYYSRARHIHETARFLVNQNHGRFPEEIEELIKLKGIGKYTAAAIAAIAFDVPVAVVDGNVMRFFSRYFGLTEPIETTRAMQNINKLANSLIGKSQPGTFNQALMEFGALQCVPVNPNCANCCFCKTCDAFRTGRVNKLPMRSNKTKTKARFFNYLLIFTPDDSIYIKRRNEKDIWERLYDLPLIENNELFTVDKLKEQNQLAEWFGSTKIEAKAIEKDYRHILTHQIIHARFFKIHLKDTEPAPMPVVFLRIPVPEFKNYPFPRLITNFFTDQELLIR
ncbi:MAG: A/G-specific adenine glycosylase [Bacteroidales bacterium]|nr:A/G-specific adenine glycosylase [Bacteroidales bacterium]MDZ4205150.1 A/G-specific adenine glycosylase [Bacteroidales bacterium]